MFNNVSNRNPLQSWKVSISLFGIVYGLEKKIVCLHSNSSVELTVSYDLIGRWSPYVFGLTCQNPRYACTTNQT